MAAKRKPAEQFQVPELETTAQPQPDPQTLAKANEAFPLPDLEDDPPRPLDKLQLAKNKLQRMQETNKIAFKFRDDLGRIEAELKKFSYSPAELEYILEPKGVKMIPGFSYTDIERQKQYINFLSAQRSPSAGHADAQDQRRDQDGSPQLG